MGWEKESRREKRWIKGRAGKEVVRTMRAI
jgi:hypothetical protein